MGGSSSKSSSNSEQYDQRVGAEGEAIAIGGEANVNIDTTSPEFFVLAEEVLSGAADIFNRNLEFAKETQGTSQEQWQKSLELLESSTRDDETVIAKSALKMAVPLAGIWAITKVMK